MNVILKDIQNRIYKLVLNLTIHEYIAQYGE